MVMEKFTIFWFRRDLRIEDNRGLYEALREKIKSSRFLSMIQQS